MFKKILSRFDGSFTASATEQPLPPPDAAVLLKLIAEHSAVDPLIGAKIGGKQIAGNLIAAMNGPHGVHVESVVCALGGLAGYACQASVRALAITRGLSETALLDRVQGTDGQTYFSGENLYKPLAESQYSVWRLASEAAQQLGCEELPELAEILRYTTSSRGTQAFGQIRVPPSHSPRDLPINYVSPMWPVLRPVMIKFCPDPEHWPVLFGYSVQEAIFLDGSELDPGIAIQIAMQAAVAMSSIDLQTV